MSSSNYFLQNNYQYHSYGSVPSTLMSPSSHNSTYNGGSGISYSNGSVSRCSGYQGGALTRDSNSGSTYTSSGSYLGTTGRTSLNAPMYNPASYQTYNPK